MGHVVALIVAVASFATTRTTTMRTPFVAFAASTSSSTRAKVDPIATSLRRRVESILFLDDIPETQKHTLSTNTNDDVNTIVPLLPVRMRLSNVPSLRTTTFDVPTIDALLSCLETRGTVAFETNATYATMYASKFYALHVGNAEDVDVDVVVVPPPPEDANAASSLVADSRSSGGVVAGRYSNDVGKTNVTNSTTTTNANAMDVILTIGRGGTVTFNGAYWDVDPTSSELTKFLIREVDPLLLRESMMPIICGNLNSTTSTTSKTTTTNDDVNDDSMAEARGKDYDQEMVACDFGLELSLVSIDDYDYDDNGVVDDEDDDSTMQNVEVGTTIVDGDASYGGGGTTSAAAATVTARNGADHGGGANHDIAGFAVPIAAFAFLVGLAVVGFVVHYHRRRERLRRADGDDDEKVRVGHGGNVDTRDMNRGRGEEYDECKVGEGLLPVGYQRSDCVDPINIRGVGSTDSSSDGSVQSQDNFSWI